MDKKFSIVTSGRNVGKTYAAIKASEFFKTVIVCPNEQSKERIMKLAQKEEIEIPEPIILPQPKQNEQQNGNEN